MLSKVSSVIRTASPYLVAGAATLYLAKFIKDQVTDKSQPLSGRTFVHIGTKENRTAGDKSIKNKQSKLKLNVLDGLEATDEKYALHAIQTALQSGIKKACKYTEAQPFMDAAYALLDKLEKQKQTHKDAVASVTRYAEKFDGLFQKLACPLTIDNVKAFGRHAATLLQEHQNFAVSIQKALKSTPVLNKGINNLFEQRYMDLFVQASNLSMLQRVNPLKQYGFLGTHATDIVNAQKEYGSIKTDLTVSKADLENVLDKQKKLMEPAAPEKEPSDQAGSKKKEKNDKERLEK